MSAIDSNFTGDIPEHNHFNADKEPEFKDRESDPEDFTEPLDEEDE